MKSIQKSDICSSMLPKIIHKHNKLSYLIDQMTNKIWHTNINVIQVWK